MDEGGERYSRLRLFHCFVKLINQTWYCYGKMMEMIAKGMDANEALEKASGQYGRVDDAAKLLDPRHE